MNGTAGIIVAALSLAGELAPYAIEGVKALIGAIQAHESAGKKLSFQDIDDLASEHSVDLEHLTSKLEEAR